eukprot:CAMPEP_0167781698 /NCGR_PEP_ID=MMETSP0111_2-20121227/6079_1 /TAXON_ID=91324 /ORGANISM="Lotharella globosa, Strain CCCM811" /LENGTH=77 /DNA_ID=CAMNT_0007672393 /DNA_START=418 /DNA_END=651 /DNA_ORIENTATION=-
MRIAIRRLFHGSFAQLLHHAGGDLHHPVGGQEEQEDVDDRIHVPLEHGDGLKRLCWILLHLRDIAVEPGGKQENPKY